MSITIDTYVFYVSVRDFPAHDESEPACPSPVLLYVYEVHVRDFPALDEGVHASDTVPGVCTKLSSSRWRRTCLPITSGTADVSVLDFPTLVEGTCACSSPATLHEEGVAYVGYIPDEFPRFANILWLFIYWTLLCNNDFNIVDRVNLTAWLYRDGVAVRWHDLNYVTLHGQAQMLV